MTGHHGNPALDAELAYRRELLLVAGRRRRAVRARRLPGLRRSL